MGLLVPHLANITFRKYFMFKKFISWLPVSTSTCRELGCCHSSLTSKNLNRMKNLTLLRSIQRGKSLYQTWTLTSSRPETVWGLRRVPGSKGQSSIVIRESLANGTHRLEERLGGEQFSWLGWPDLARGRGKERNTGSQLNLNFRQPMNNSFSINMSHVIYFIWQPYSWHHCPWRTCWSLRPSHSGWWVNRWDEASVSLRLGEN